MTKITDKVDAEIKWYVLSANYRKELEVRDELLGLGYQAYVPMQYGLTTVKGRRQRVLKPAVSALVFVRATQQQLFDYKHSSINNPYVFFRSTRHGDRWTPIVVRDEDMENFMRITSVADAGLRYYRPEELRLAEGQQVRIMEGVFKDVVGTIQKLPHKHGDYLVVEIPGVSVVAASIKSAYVQPVGTKVAKSVNVDADVRRLGELACRLLYDYSTEDVNKGAQLGVLSELKTIRQSLEGCKTFMPSDRAEYALAHLLAALALNEDPSEPARRLGEVVPRLRSVSLLRLRASIYLAECCGDKEAAAFVSSTMAQWDLAKCSDAQKKIVAEKRMVEKRFAR